ncbi:MAG: C40 family peptidase [Oscillospiraceae bacterium]
MKRDGKEPGPRREGPAASGQNVPNPKYRQQSKQASAGTSGPAEKFRQKSRQAPPSDRLHRDGQTGQGAANGQTAQKPESEKLRKARQRMERRGEKVETARDKLARQKPVKKPGPVKQAAGFAGRSVHGFVHGKIYEVEQENVGTEGAHRSELVAEAAGRKTVRFTQNRVRTHPARAVRRAESKYAKAAADVLFREAAAENPGLSKNALARMWRKRQQRKRYQKQAREAAKQSARAAEKTAVTTEKLAARATGAIKRHPVAALIILLCVLLIFSIQSCSSSLVAIGNGIAGSVTATTYPAEDADLLGAEAAYAGMEAELQDYLNTYISTHSYDEYHFDLDDIEHDPYVLLSILSAFHEDCWTLADVEDDLQTLFDRQYILTEIVTVEVRYRTETRTDSEGNAYEVEVPYNYYICTVTLENFNLSHVPVYIMGEDQLSRYSLYMAALGNRPDLFPNSVYVSRYITDPPTIYEVPPEALADETFATMLAEAEKYIGYPYVWGGSNPSTSFDCSGFVSWVINHSGWDVGRLGAQGLYNICTPVSSANARPGDLVFFVGTYDTPGVSHVGIYVGDGWMIHCGDVRPDRTEVEVDERRAA